jgi:hypothetical protein
VKRLSGQGRMHSWSKWLIGLHMQIEDRVGSCKPGGEDREVKQKLQWLIQCSERESCNELARSHFTSSGWPEHTSTQRPLSTLRFNK